MSRIGPIVIEIQPPAVRDRLAEVAPYPLPPRRRTTMTTAYSEQARQVFRGYEDGYQGRLMDRPKDETLRKAYCQAYDDGRAGRLAEWADNARRGGTP